MSNKLIFIPIELPVRELASSAMLASYLSSKGMKVVIGSQLHIKNLALNSKKSIYLDKTLYSAHYDFYKILSKKNISIFCDDIEASGCHVPEIYAQARFSQKNLDLASGIFFWGNDDYNAVKNYYDFSEIKCHKSGSFRTFYWKNFSQKIPSNIQKMSALKEKYGNFVFIPSNFGGSMRPDGTHGVINQAKKNYPHLLNKISKRIEHIEKRRILFVEDIIKLVDSFKHINFIFRPHPNEEIKKWIKLLPKKENLIIEYKGSVTEYIMAANTIVHSGCTSAFESYFYKKPCIAHVPEKNRKWDSWQANTMSEETENFCSLKEKLTQSLASDSNIKNTNPFYELKDDLLEYYFKAFDRIDSLSNRDYKTEVDKLESNFLFNSLKIGLKSITNKDFKHSEIKFSKNDTIELDRYLKFFNAQFDADRVSIKKINDKVLMLL
tara:strand:+ start:18995 stop:20305 length:1311 start_codon:yes stop_codon:yes gene_type:complete